MSHVQSVMTNSAMREQTNAIREQTTAMREFNDERARAIQLTTQEKALQEKEKVITTVNTGCLLMLMHM